MLRALSKTAVVALTLSLAGCLSSAKQPVSIEYVQVDRPVQVPCKVKVPRKPEDIVASLKTSDSLFTKMKYLLAARDQTNGYTTELEAAVNECNANK